MICVAYPTIMSGLVLRWFVDEEGFKRGDEVASAGRECALVEPQCPAEICRLADAAHDYLHAAYGRFLRPNLDVSRWVTHTTRFMSAELTPIPDAQPARIGGVES